MANQEDLSRAFRYSSFVQGFDGESPNNPTDSILGKDDCFGGGDLTEVESARLEALTKPENTPKRYNSLIEDGVEED